MTPPNKDPIELAAEKYFKDTGFVPTEWAVMMFKAGAQSQQAVIKEQQALLDECERVVERLTKVGPPSKPTTGSEWASQALEDNCNIAKELLTKLRERKGE